MPHTIRVLSDEAAITAARQWIEDYGCRQRARGNTAERPSSLKALAVLVLTKETAE
jgi:hypothetical protein